MPKNQGVVVGWWPEGLVFLTPKAAGRGRQKAKPEGIHPTTTPWFLGIKLILPRFTFSFMIKNSLLTVLLTATPPRATSS